MAGDGLLHPVAIVAIVVLILNDHYFKAVWPGPITGKVSDFAGLLFFPLLLQAVWEIGLAVSRRYQAPSRLALLVSIAVTGVLFVSIKLVPEAHDLVAAAMGVGQWLVGGAGVGGPSPVTMSLDGTDLVALPTLALTYLIGVRRCR